MNLCIFPLTCLHADFIAVCSTNNAAFDNVLSVRGIGVQLPKGHHVDLASTPMICFSSDALVKILVLSEVQRVL
jgi:hypothetical protein